MNKILVVLMALSLALALVPAGALADEDGCSDCEPVKMVKLLAGQDLDVGLVTITNDDEQICVTYALNEDALNEGWLIY